jgi:hypothetical protein
VRRLDEPQQQRRDVVGPRLALLLRVGHQLVGVAVATAARLAAAAAAVVVLPQLGLQLGQQRVLPPLAQQRALHARPVDVIGVERAADLGH